MTYIVVTPWAYQEVVSSTKLNLMVANTVDHEARLVAIGTTLTATDATGQTGTAGADFVYATCQITLTDGTWQVQGGASVNTNVNDNAAASLYDQTAGADVANSKGSAAGVPSTLGIGAAIVSRPTVITVTGSKVIRVKCSRNGAGTVLTATTGFMAGAPAAWLNAVRVK